MKKLIWITFCTVISLWLTLPGFTLAQESDQINPDQREVFRERWQNQSGEKRSGHREGRRYNSQRNNTQRRKNHQ